MEELKAVLIKTENMLNVSSSKICCTYYKVIFPSAVLGCISKEDAQVQDKEKAI